MKWHRNMHKIIIVSPALSIIEQEAYQALKENQERGGSLAGIQTGNTSIILHAIPTGPHAQTSWGQIRTDADFQNKHLATLAAHYNQFSTKVNYQSDYHVHQMGLDELSSTDNATLLSILLDPNHAYLQGMPVILASVHHGKPKYIPYWITRAGSGVRTEKAEMEIVTPDDPRIVALLRGHVYVPLDEIMRQHTSAVAVGPRDADQPFSALAQGDILMTRLVLEVEYLRAVFSIEAQLRRTLSGYPCLVAQVGDFRLFAVIPSEFPLNPATVFFHKPGTGDITEYNPRRVWNSLARIADVFEELLAANAATPAVNNPT